MVEIAVKEIMTTKVITVPAAMPVEQVAQVLSEQHITGLPVVDQQKRVIGIVSEFDLLSRRGATAADIMSREVVSVSEETDAGEVAQLLTNQRIRRVPVLDAGRLVGIVSRSDLVRLFTLTRWICARCGYFERGFDRPTRCAVCSADQVVLQREAPGM